MSRHGKIEEFVPGPSSNWQQYVERFAFFFQANDIVTPDKQRAVFLASCGPSIYALVRSLLQPSSPETKTFAEIVDVVSNHFTPKPSEIMERFRFNKRNQLPTESIADYVSELRRLSEHCGYGDALEIMIRDRLVCVLREETLQTRLLEEANLSLKSALKICLASETASRNTSDIRTCRSENVLHVNSSKRGAGKNNDNRSSQKSNSASFKPCYRCNGSHDSDSCKFKGAVCDYCHKLGHIQPACMSKIRDSKRQGNNGNKRKQRVNNSNCNNVSVDSTSKCNDESVYTLYNMDLDNNPVPPTYVVAPAINGISHAFEVDSGCGRSLISENTFSKLWPRGSIKLQPSTIKARTWSRQVIQPLGTAEVSVEFNGNKVNLPLLVMKGSGPSLLGRNWFKHFGIQLTGLNSVSFEVNSRPAVQSILDKYDQVFSKEVGTFDGPLVHIDITPDAVPKFRKARPVPFALRASVDEEIERLVNSGLWRPVKHSRWASPIVVVPKKNGKIRICGDYSDTVNPVMVVEQYPLPTVTELLSTLAGGTVFTKLDFEDAYAQLSLDEASQELLTFNTQKGLFAPTRLTFGSRVAAAVFQRFIETELKGIPRTVAYQDDTLLSGTDVAQHDQILTQVLDRLVQKGLKLKKEKCYVSKPSVDFLGFRIDSTGVHPLDEKIKSIRDAPPPVDKAQLQSFLGLVNYYACFMPNKATVLEPLHRLLDAHAKWSWTKSHQDSFDHLKKLVHSSSVLVHYDLNKPLLLACDASPYGVGAVLEHVMPDGTERPVAFASRTMSSTERNYAQIDKEALSIIFAVKKFHQYLFGRHFKIYTDHKPLLGILNPRKAIPLILSPRMLRWRLLLDAYSFELCYRPGDKHCNADALSRLPIKVPDNQPPDPADVLLFELDEASPLTDKEIATLSRNDPEISAVLRQITSSAPWSLDDPCFQPFKSRLQELSVHKGCLLWGSRVVIPNKARSEVLHTLHTGHPGVVVMKALARSYVWWPGLDQQIEDFVHGCHACQANRNALPSDKSGVWSWPSAPWSRIHLDFAGPFQRQMFLILVDAHSKWLEVRPVPSTSADVTIAELRSIFATFGLPARIVSDNGSPFSSAAFGEFLKRNGIRHSFAPPYHPSTNGQAERLVQTTKSALRKISSGDWKLRLARFLFSQHMLPSTVTGQSPAELLMGRKLPSHLDLLHPDIRRDMHNKQYEQYVSSTPNGPRHVYSEGAPVYVRNYSRGDKWVPAVVSQVSGPLQYSVSDLEGRVLRRHTDQMRRRTSFGPSQDPVVEPVLPSTSRAVASYPLDPAVAGGKLK